MTTIEEKIIEWSRSNLPERYHDAGIKLLTNFYVKKNVAKKVSDCYPNQKAELKLTVSKVRHTRTRICKSCKHRDCEPSCGKNEYIKRYRIKYWATDEDGDQIFINIPPFEEKEIEELKKKKLYRVVGKTTEYRDELYIRPEEISPVEEFSDKPG